VKAFMIRNIVASINLLPFLLNQKGTVIDLYALGSLDRDNYEYEPELFPACSCNFNGIKVIVFHTGKLNFTGIKNLTHFKDCFKKFICNLIENKIIQLK